MSTRLRRGRQLRRVPGNLSNPLPVASGNLLFADLFSQAPITASSSTTCAQISDASRHVQGSAPQFWLPPTS